MIGSADARARWGSWHFPLAYLGAHLAFIPVLVLLLPRRVEALVDEGAPLVLSWLLLAGALAASAAHVLAGHWSDRWILRFGSRRGIIAIGLVALLASFVPLAAASTVAEMAVALVAFQLALNLAFAPLGALLADHVPDVSKGSVAGLLAAALPLSSGSVAFLAWLFPRDSGAAFIVNGLLVAACMTPLLIRWSLEPPLQTRAPQAVEEAPPPTGGRHDFALAWIARFLVQLGAAFVIGFLFLVVSEQIVADPSWAGGLNVSNAIALLSLGATAVAIIGAIAGGRLSDRARARRGPAAISACVAAACLIGLGSEIAWPFFLAAFVIFQLALSAFLAIDTALVAQLVGGSSRRGALLGVMNLANTLPAVLAAAIAVVSLDAGVIGARLGLFFYASGGAAICAGIAILWIRRVR